MPEEANEREEEVWIETHRGEMLIDERLSLKNARSSLISALPRIASFEAVDNPEERSVKFESNDLPILNSFRSQFQSELKRLEEKREKLESEQAAIIEKMSKTDAEIYAIRDFLKRVNSVCKEEKS